MAGQARSMRLNGRRTSRLGERMALSAAQMAQMSALLDEALGLDEAGRRQWLERLGPEHGELEGALRQALLPQESDGAGSDRLATLGSAPISWSGRSDPAAWPRCGWRSAPTGPSSVRWR